MNKKINSYTDEEFLYLVQTTTSLTKVANIIGCKKYLVDNRAKQLNVYYNNQGQKGIHKKSGHKYLLEDILAGKYPKYEILKLKKRLIKAGILEDKCAKCGFNEHAEGNEFSICELHHKDGNNENHCLENLEILCPNCHALTDNYKFRKRKHKSKFENDELKKNQIEKLALKEQKKLNKINAENLKKSLKLQQQLKKEQEIENLRQLLLNSNIDFSKQGWVGKVANILNISYQHVNQWMKKNMMDFYINNCFKRKTRV